MIRIQVKRLPHGEGLSLPKYMSAHAAGMDLLAAVNGDVTIESGKRALIPTGISIALPVGYEAQVRPRSGLAIKSGVSVLNTPGTIDADYRGEVCVILVNHDSDAFKVKRGDRIAQMVIKEVIQAELEEVAELPDSHRGSGGFGHTGI